MIYLYGAGGHAKVIADMLELNGLKPAGYFDDDPAKKIWDYPGFLFPNGFNFLTDQLVISIGNNRVRKDIAEKIKAIYFTVVHPSATISPRCFIAEGTVIMGGALVNPDALVGKHCIINSNAVVEHECLLADFVHISPNATLCGNVTIGEGVHVGAGAVVKQGIHIGSNAIIGAGAVVIRDIPAGALVAGNPAKKIYAGGNKPG